MALQPRSGLDGVWDHLVGPGANGREQAAAVGGAAIGALAGILGPRRPLERVLGAAIGADAGGGVVANETASVKTWYRRTGVSRWEPVTFAALHVYPFLVEAASGRRSWGRAAASWALPVAGASLVVVRGDDPRRTAAWAAAGVAALGTVLAPQGWRWLPALLAVKLVFGHPTPPGLPARLLRQGDEP